MKHPTKEANDLVHDHTGALALISMPLIFTQDELLNTEEFIKKAEDRGYRLSLEDLQELHARQLLVPFYRVSDTALDDQHIKVVVNGTFNCRREALKAALDGRLRDSADEEYSSDWPYRRPPDEKENKRWWNGFLYSSWQLLDLHMALNDQRWLDAGLDNVVCMERAQRRRNCALALAALASCYVPSILSQASLPPGIDEHELRRYRFDSDIQQLLSAVGLDPGQLRAEAEELLHEARRDPLREWLPLVRHANYSAWSKLRGEPLDCLWIRIGAEILLRAHEDLAASGKVEPLPDLGGTKWWTPLHDRVSWTCTNAEPLEQVLGSFGLSPHPRVLILVEGETELVHFRLLLEQFGINMPEQVRVQYCKGAGVNPQLLVRYAISPRIGNQLGDAWKLIATPTALVIAMDPENMWATAEKRETQQKKIKKAIREQVQLQGGQIGDTELDFLVNIYVWRDDFEYEFANFTDEELLPAITSLASGPKAQNKGSAAWQQETRQKLQDSRQDHTKIDAVIGPLRIAKPALAEALGPKLLARCEQEFERDVIETPILKIMLEVQRLVVLLSGGSHVLPRSSVEDSS